MTGSSATAWLLAGALLVASCAPVDEKSSSASAETSAPDTKAPGAPQAQAKAAEPTESASPEARPTDGDEAPPSLKPMRAGPGVSPPMGLHCPPLDLGGHTLGHYKWPLTVGVIIDSRGRVISATNTDGQADFETVLETAKRCTFTTPATFQGKPVPVITTLTFRPGS